MVIVPDSMVSSRLIARQSVDLPEPEGPMTTTTSPRADGEVDVLEHVQVTEVLVDALEDDEGLGHAANLATDGPQRTH